MLDVGAGADVPVPPFATERGRVMGADVGQLTRRFGKVPTVQPFVPVGAGAETPVPPFTTESGSPGPAEAVGHTGT